MADETAEQGVSPESRSVFSWPPTPSMTGFHILARSVLILNDGVGIGLCFAAGLENDASSDFIAASFMIVALFTILPFVAWNIALLKRGSSRHRHGYKRMEQNGEEPSVSIKKTKGTAMLKFAILVDLLGFSAFLVIYPFTVIEAQDFYRWANPVLGSYASVTALIAWIIHLILVFTQFLQLLSTFKSSKRSSMHCPNCNHTMRRLSHESMPPGTGVEASSSVVPDARDLKLRTEENLVDTDDDTNTFIAMAPGQVTGTCTRTPRVSTSVEETLKCREQAESSRANEEGEYEGDGLLDKSA